MILDSPRSARIVAATALVASSVIAPSVTATAVAATAGVTPAIGVHPSYRYVGDSHSDAALYSCQTKVPATCYGPDQIRAAYGVDTLASRGLTGAGQTIVIVDAYQAPAIQADLDSFDADFGLPAGKVNIIAPDGLTPYDATNATQVGWAGEISLDVEWAHAIAPGATLDLVLAKSSQDDDILSATKYAVDHNLGSIISQSFGEAEQCVDPAIMRAQHAVFESATAKGITLLASSGDQGAAQPSCDGSTFVKAASSPASDPDVTGVGGTALVADGTTGAYKSESTWNEPQYGSAGGGGFSIVYKEPGYQRPVQKSGVRAVPDIAYNAAINGGVLTVYSEGGVPGGVYRFGGTSAGSPQWAGLVALANQLKGGRVGFINDTLYHLASAQKAYAADFHDVTTGDNSYPFDGGTISGFAAGTGWDPATGLGTPKAATLIPALAQKS